MLNGSLEAHLYMIYTLVFSEGRIFLFFLGCGFTNAWVSTSSSASTSNSKSENFFMSPYGVYDMDDSSFFAHTTRLNIKGPNPNSTQFLKHGSSSTERLLINGGERSMVTAIHKTNCSLSPTPPVPPVPEKRTSPTDAYMELSLQSSLPLTDPNYIT